MSALVHIPIATPELSADERDQMARDTASTVLKAAVEGAFALPLMGLGLLAVAIKTDTSFATRLALGISVGLSFVAAIVRVTVGPRLLRAHKLDVNPSYRAVLVAAGINGGLWGVASTVALAADGVVPVTLVLFVVCGFSSVMALLSYAPSQVVTIGWVLGALGPAVVVAPFAAEPTMAFILSAMGLGFLLMLVGTARRMHADYWQNLYERASSAARNRTLTRARDEANRASRAKSTFLAMMSHEMRTPMNGVIGTTDVLLTGDLKGQQREFVQLIQSSASDLLGLINDLLDLSQAEGGGLKIVKQPFALEQVVDDVVDLVRVRYRNVDDTQVVVDYEPDMPRHFVGDASRIRQVLLNLVVNGVKYTDGGTVTVRFSIANYDGQHLRVEVHDTGVGIAPADLHKVFNPFTRLEGVEARRQGGAGLGLAISKSLVDLMGGEINATSMPGSGSTFQFSIPIEVAPRRERPVDAFGTVVLCTSEQGARHLLVAQLKSLGARRVLTTEPQDLITTLATSETPVEAVVLASDTPRVVENLCRALAPRRKAGLAVVHVRRPGDEMAEASTVDGTLELPARQAGFRAVLKGALAASAARAAEATVQDEEAPTEDSTPVSVDGPTASRPPILLVEDNVVNQQVAAHMLRRLGCEVTTVGDGHDAVEAVQKREFALVLMDVQMPLMDGFEATSRIRALGEAYADLPIVAVTAHVSASERVDCLAAGMNDHLAKPLTFSTLSAVLSRWADAPTELPA